MMERRDFTQSKEEKMKKEKRKARKTTGTKRPAQGAW